MTPHPEISAIILSAGFSRRMGAFKPLMKLGGRTVLDRVVSLYRQAGVTDIRVVTGFRSEAIRSALGSQPLTVVPNPEYQEGMFASVKAGVRTLGSDVRFFFVHPVDIPLVRPHTLRTLMDASEGGASMVVYPCFDGQRGHPPLIRAGLKDAVVSHDGSGGLRCLLERNDATARQVALADEGVLMDLDTPDDFQRLSDRLGAAHCLTRDECRVLMHEVGCLPAPVIDHCRRVACVATALSKAVNAGGGAIDVRLADAAARVHDVARLEKNHAAAGARLLREMGFLAMAAIVAVHMELSVTAGSLLDEAQIVYLADKLVTGDKLASLSRRFDAALKKHGRDPQAT
ncbi:MAG: DVU_1551 family NTP transferase, partial [Desulfosarcina sp.]